MRVRSVSEWSRSPAAVPSAQERAEKRERERLRSEPVPGLCVTGAHRVRCQLDKDGPNLCACFLFLKHQVRKRGGVCCAALLSRFAALPRRRSAHVSAKKLRDEVETWARELNADEASVSCSLCADSVSGETAFLEDYVLGVGDTLEMSCELDDPSQPVAWFKDGRGLAPGNRTRLGQRMLRVINVSYEDSGVYSCRLAHGNALLSNYTIRVTGNTIQPIRHGTTFLCLLSVHAEIKYRYRPLLLGAASSRSLRTESARISFRTYKRTRDNEITLSHFGTTGWKKRVVE
ncbi:hypothetical protein F2P81_002977 [Scophthalmus maximus]|uniref:Ig-like domain-containing protein n=1 Tax=Scophthalmus maximus TaxID=52904 RepID=A0A6A4TG61_SCOMX|nr:hypothetical protein F2P81_002977 [Scophthalmus maximus]